MFALVFLFCFIFFVQYYPIMTICCAVTQHSRMIQRNRDDVSDSDVQLLSPFSLWSTFGLFSTFSWPRVSSEPRRLRRLLMSRNDHARTLATRALASMKTLPEWICAELILSCYDASVLASLALRGSNIPNYMMHRFKCANNIENISIDTELRALLCELHPYTEDSCVALRTQLALVNSPRPPSSEHDEVLWTDQDDEERPISFGQSTKIRQLVIYMEALGLLSTLPYQRERMVDARTFDLLGKLWKFNKSHFSNDFRLPILTLKVISNLALSSSSSQHFLYSGWIGTLTKCRKSEKIELNLLAEKCLANLANGLEKGGDGESRGIVYDDGVYVLHDSWDRKAKADIIFVHGLRGGVFYSWRQKDTAKQYYGGRGQIGSSTYTYCWPKDWLPHDIGANVRILGIDYASFVTDWRQKCPEFKERNTIISRSKDLLEKLTKARVGEKPIIWICHSMGGLLVKELLCGEQSNDTNSERSNLVNKTTGIAFYSVPHRGSPIASRSVESSYRYFLLPSVEVSELRENSQYLQLLQQSFSQLAKGNIEIINFTETLPPKFPMRIKALVVPETSSDIGFGSYYRLNETHLNTCKPFTRDSVNYTILAEFLKRLLV